MKLKNNIHLSLLLRKEIIYSFMHLCHLLADIPEACWRNRGFHFILQINTQPVNSLLPLSNGSCRRAANGHLQLCFANNIRNRDPFSTPQIKRVAGQDLIQPGIADAGPVAASWPSPSDWYESMTDKHLCLWEMCPLVLPERKLLVCVIHIQISEESRKGNHKEMETHEISSLAIKKPNHITIQKTHKNIAEIPWKAK